MITKESKKNHIANLIKIAKADNVLTNEEVVFIKSIAIKLGITSNEFNEIALNTESVKEESPTTQEGKIQVLYEILTMMSLDMDANEEEIKICNHIGQLIGFSEEQVGKAIKLSVDNVDNVITKEQIASIVA